jgi:Reverse transcriptase (RNA-dependent DNA polymerase)
LPLTAIPSAIEIWNCLKSMGLDRAPGPDGITARFLLWEWHLLGPEVITHIQAAFRHDQAPQMWMRSHLVLIPKTDQPSKPVHFRPLSICSIFYRLLTKIIANRVKPLLPGLISTTQSAFQKGHNIQDNILLMKEVLHSFQSSDYKENSFALKADLFKAFDTIGWVFLKLVLQKMGFPQVLINLVVLYFRF